MFLKSLEIRGFKSFADKTELKFDKGITAVVGPNGSGKSNISDAVRWVLGEQSVKTLRGSKMEDVIFTGTQYRKPIGFAQVSLTLDNSEQELPLEFMDVKISRRIFRSGESEYLINNSQCRLKDVVQLFMDTGIGKEGYSLIGQGKIDAILSGKPEERRNLLEEAAGIVKFKSRKTEAERKLKNTNENLVRINDIIFTYEERIGPLEKEKDKALKFVDLSNELKEKEIALIVSNLKSINNDISTRKREIDSLIKKSEEYKIELNKKRDLIKNEKDKLEEAENTHNEDQKLYLNKKEIITKAKSDIDLFKERINNLEEALRKNNIDLTSHKEKISYLNEQKENLETDLKNKQEILNKHNEEILKVEEDIKVISIELEEKRKKLNQIKNKELDNIKKIAEMKNKSFAIEGEIKNIKFNLEHSKVSIGNFKNSLKINSVTKIDLEKQLNKVKVDIRDLEISIENNLKEKEKLTSDIFNLKKQLSIVMTSINKLDANKEMLKKLEKQYEGYNISVKRIMESIEEGHVSVDKKKCVVLGEVLKTFKGYEVAIEVSLGAAISNIITEDENTAKLLINHLKQKRLGRATFLPLSIIKGRKLVLDNSIQSVKGYLGIASELVNYDNKYQNIINYSLGKTIIASDIDSAIIIAKKANYRYRIVTLQGEVINSGGAMTGGSIHHKNMGIISRKSEIDSLDAKIKESLENKRNLDEKIKQFEEILEKLNKQRKCFTDKIYTNNIKNVDLKGKLNNINHVISDLESNIKNENIKVEEYLISLKGLEDQFMKSGENAKELSFKDEEEKQISIILEKDINALTNKIQNIKEESTETKIKKAQLKEYIDNKIKELSKCQKDSEEVWDKIAEIKNYIKQSEENIKQSEESILKNKEIIASEESYIYSLEEKYRNFQMLKAKLKQDISKVENEMEISTIEASKLDEEIHRKEILYTKQEGEQEGYYEKLEDEYNTSYEEVCYKFSVITNLDEHKSKVASLKGKIASLGLVNVNAVEEFKELSEKYKFITSEKEDLEKAKEELLNVIDEMTSKMKVVFRQNFNTLNKYFNETFKELFKGGSAKLILDEGDELNGNIEINVQPPGKKVQNINLMSGGEKVLSAIALLFGILKMKPTPFCILDEIEAALDDANVNRYSEFLRKFSGDIQFIVITHRKGTMAAADVMYGVTMEEKGISKVVSVDLSK